MHVEVEQKYRVADLARVERQLLRMGVRLGEPRIQVDQYFSHPCRDFAVTDEALRIRQAGGENRLTFKGPKLEATTKSRREIELPLDAGLPTAQAWQQLLEALGFRPVARVRKQRRTGIMEWESRQVEIALDQVDGAGSFVELECSADEAGFDAARQTILSLAGQLELSGAERRSYLELVQGAADKPAEPSLPA